MSPGVGSLGPVREIKRYCEAHNNVVKQTVESCIVRTLNNRYDLVTRSWLGLEKLQGDPSARGLGCVDNSSVLCGGYPEIELMTI